MFSDIEDSTVLTERLGDQAWQDLLRKHNALIREQLRAHGGYEVKTMGDGFMVAFQSAKKGLDCAIAIQTRIRRAQRVDGEHVKVRIGLHAGEAIKDGDDFYGKNVILASRVAGKAVGGEILVSSLLRAARREQRRCRDVRRAARGRAEGPGGHAHRLRSLGVVTGRLNGRRTSLCDEQPPTSDRTRAAALLPRRCIREVVRHLDYHGARPLAKRAPQPARRLVVQPPLPRPRRHEVRQYHRHELRALCPVERVDIRQHGRYERAVWRVMITNGTSRTVASHSRRSRCPSSWSSVTCSAVTLGEIIRAYSIVCNTARSIASTGTSTICRPVDGWPCTAPAGIRTRASTPE